MIINYQLIVAKIGAESQGSVVLSTQFTDLGVARRHAENLPNYSNRKAVAVLVLKSVDGTTSIDMVEL